MKYHFWVSEQNSRFQHGKYSKVRDLDLNYYLRSSREVAASKRRQAAGSLHQLAEVNALVSAGRASFHTAHPLNRYPLYAALLYLGPVVVCSLTCLRTIGRSTKELYRAEVDNDTGADRTPGQTLIPGSSTSLDPPKPLGRASLSWSSFTVLFPWRWSFGYQDLSSPGLTRKIPLFPPRPNLSEESTGLSNHDPNFAPEESIFQVVSWTLSSINEIWPEYRSERCRSAMIDFVSSLGHFFSQCSQSVSRGYRFVWSGRVIDSMSSSPGVIGSSQEGVWDENSPLINPEMPNQLRSLLVLPELCV